MTDDVVVVVVVVVVVAVAVAVAVAVVVVVVLLTKFGLSDKVALLASLSHAADIGGQSVI